MERDVLLKNLMGLHEFRQCDIGSTYQSAAQYITNLERAVKVMALEIIHGHGGLSNTTLSDDVLSDPIAGPAVRECMKEAGQ